MESSSRNKRSRKAEPVDSGEDPFDRLPDEVISSHILSRLTFEERARYCILSHRWMKLWSRTIGPKFIFTSSSINKKIPIKNEDTMKAEFEELRPCLERWITNVLQCYCGPKLEEFTVRLPFHSSSRDAIDTWLECALRKRVTRLELDFSSWTVRKFDNRYIFPEIGKIFSKPAYATSIRYLTDVCFKSVRIGSKNLEILVAKCPIERLCISHCDIGDARISGELIRLKSLELVSCSASITILVSSLVSVKCHCLHNFGLHLEDVPQLKELSISDGTCTTTLRKGLHHFDYITRLRRLELVMSAEDVCESINYSLEFPEALQLEELEVRQWGWERQYSCLLWPILLIKASPFLRKFCFQMPPCLTKNIEEVEEVDLTRIRDAAKIVNSHRYLKLVEFREYFGAPCEVELIQHLLSISECLEQFVISPLYLSRDREHVSVATYRQEARDVAISLLPPYSKIDVVVV